MNEVNSCLLDNEDLNQTVMNSLMDEISSSGSIKTEMSDEGGHSHTTTFEELEGNVMMRVQRMEVVKPETAEMQEKNLGSNLLKKDGKGVNPVGFVGNLKELELVRDETGMFKCLCCWKVNSVLV